MKPIGYYIVKGFFYPISKLPLGYHRFIGRRFGHFAGNIVKYRRDVVMANLSRSFPDKKYEELTDICNRFYKHFGQVLGEAIWFGGCSVKRLKKSHIVEFENPEELNRLYNNSKSVFMMLSHMGNWELIGGYKSYTYGDVQLDVPENDVCVVYKQLSSAVWDTFMNENRQSVIVDKEHFDGVVESMQILFYAYHNKDVKKIYHFITDQSPYTVNGRVKVNDFMHQPTVSMNGGAAFAKMFNMPVAYLSFMERPEGGYKLRVVTITEDPGSMEVEDILNKYYELIQKDLEEQPWNYLWTHKRWKL